MPAETGTKNPAEPLKLPPKELKKCDCPLWVIGVDLWGQFHRESLDAQHLTTAASRIQKLELGEPILKPLPDALILAFTSFRADTFKSRTYGR
jgi:hypothetical protein